MCDKVRDIPEWAGAEKPWTAYPGKSLIASSEAHFLYDRVKNLGSGNYANLGTFTGFSTACLAFGLKQLNSIGKVYTVDNYCYENLKDYPELMIKNLKELDIDQYVEVCVGTTNEWAEKLKDIRFKFIFVDADHSRLAVESDIINWTPLLEDDGEIAFHDVFTASVNDAIEGKLKDWKFIRQVRNIKVFKKLK